MYDKVCFVSVVAYLLLQICAKPRQHPPEQGTGAARAFFYAAFWGFYAKFRAMEHTARQPDPTRHTAYQCLRAVFTQQTTLEQAFEVNARTLAGRDRAFAYTLAITATRYALALDALTAKLMQKPFPDGSAAQQLLRIGACQLLLLDGVKDHAAISSTVDMAKAYNLGKISGVINGVLRNIQRKFTKQDIRTLDAIPRWLKTRLEKTYPNPAALAEAMLSQALADLRLRKGDAPEGATPLKGLPDGWQLPEGMLPQSLEARLARNDIYIQDGGAQWPAHILINHLREEGPLLDLCAAPGGKTLQLADHADRFTLAADRSESRTRTMTSNLAGTQNVGTCIMDGRTPPLHENTFAGILLDAPCTATGTTRRHPEVMHLRLEKDIQALTFLQPEMLKKAAPLLKKGGVLMYAVCSLLVEEGEDQNKWITDNLPLKPLKITGLPAKFARNQPTENALRLTPLDGTDGFYMALYQKA